MTQATYYVCVKNPKTVKQLILTASAQAEDNEAVEVIYVHPEARPGSRLHLRQITDFEQICHDTGVQLTVLFSENAAEAIAAYIKDKDAKQVLTGCDTQQQHFFARRLQNLLPHVPVAAYSRTQKQRAVSYSIA